jgi:agmatinase
MFDYVKLWSGLATDDIDKAKISIMGVPFDGGASLGKGAALAPRIIRLLAAEGMPGATEDRTIIQEELIYDAGDVEPSLNWDKFFEEVEDKAYELMRADTFCLFIGGDHSVTIPLQKAFGKHQKQIKSGKIGIIHLDAHPDLCDHFDGHKWSHANTEARALEDVISPGDLCFAGIRAFEEEEVRLLDSYPEISTYTARDVWYEGVANISKKIENQFKDYDAVYLTLDIDVLDPAYAPGTGTPVSGGLNNRELTELVKYIVLNLPVRAMDIVEVSPPLDVNDITSWAAIRVMHEIFGHFST